MKLIIIFNKELNYNLEELFDIVGKTHRKMLDKITMLQKYLWSEQNFKTIYLKSDFNNDLKLKINGYKHIKVKYKNSYTYALIVDNNSKEFPETDKFTDV